MIIKVIRTKPIVSLLMSALILGSSPMAIASKKNSFDYREPASQTRQMLLDPSQREEFLKKHEDARAADQKVINAVGAQNKEETYQIAADIMDNMLKETNGDPQALQKIMQDVQTNPEAFYQRLTPEQKKRIKGLADQIESQKKSQ